VAVVGEAKIVVRAITNTFKRDVERAASGLNEAGQRAGRDFGDGVSRGFGRRARSALSPGFVSSIEAARQQFRRLAIASNIVVPAIAALVGIIGNLVSGLVILVAAAGNAAKALGVGLLGAISAVAQAGITLGVAFKGFGEAMNQARGASNGAANAARQEEAALRRLRDARLNLKRLIEEEAPAELAAARQQAADAADRAAAAIRDSERAQRDYNDAQLEVLEAQEDLNDARDRAREKLQQLRFALEGAAIGEKRARLEFEKARDSLQAVQDLPPDSRARQEAELAFAQAELNLRKAIDNNSDLRKEEAAATAAGVEGSEEVVTAKERIADAIQAEKDAAIDAAIAIRDAARAQEEANQAAADAAAGGRVERELQRRIALAREQVRDAERAVEDARRSAASAVNQVRVTPEQLAFAQYLRSLSDEFYNLRRAAGQDLFPALEVALGKLVEDLFPALQPLLRGTGGVIGEIAVGFAEVATEGENIRRLESVWTTNDELLRNLGVAGGNLYEALLLILEAAEPVITAFGEWAASSSGEFVKNLSEDTDGLRESFEQNLETFRDFKEILDNLFSTFGNLGESINTGGGAAILLGYLKDVTEGFDEFTANNQDFLDDFFRDSALNFTELLDLVGLIGKGFLELLAIGLAIGSAFRVLKFLGKAFAGFIRILPGGAGFLRWGKAVGTVFSKRGIASGIKFVFSTIGNFFKSIPKFIRGFGSKFIGFFKSIPGLIGKFFASNLGKILLRIGGFLLRGIGVVLGGIPGLVILIIATLVTIFFQFKDEIIGFFKELGTGIWEGMQEAGRRIQEWWSGLNERTQEATRDLVMKVAEAGANFFSWIGDLWNEYWAEQQRRWDEMVTGIKALPGKIKEAGAKLWNGFKEVWDEYWAEQKRRFDDLVADVKALPGKLAEAGRNLWNWLKDSFKTAINWVIDRWNNLSFELRIPDKIGSLPLPDWLAGKGVTVNTPNIPRLAMGGVVYPSSGGTLAMLAEAGRPERVEPLDSDGLSKRDRAMIAMLSGGGAQIHVYPAPGMNETELAQKVSRELAKQVRRGQA